MIDCNKQTFDIGNVFMWRNIKFNNAQNFISGDNADPHPTTGINFVSRKQRTLILKLGLFVKCGDNFVLCHHFPFLSE